MTPPGGSLSPAPPGPAAASTSPAGGRAADLILHSGTVWDGAHLPGVEAVAVAGGRILAVGSDQEMSEWAGPATRRVDVGGRRIVPGLIDSHLHMVRAGATWQRHVRWHDLPRLGEGLEAVREAAQARGGGEWLAVMGGWHPGQFEERRPPTREELDQVAPANPVFVQRNYIEAFLNTRALEELGWEARDGRVEGLAALQALRERLPTPAFEEQMAATQSLLQDLTGWGLTGCIDAGGFGMSPPAYEPVAALHRSHRLGFRARLLVGAGRAGDELSQIQDWMGLVSPGSGDDRLGYLGAGEVVVFAAHDMEGLDDRDISSQRDALAEASRLLAEAGWPLHIHAILDRSVGTVLDAWEGAGLAERAAGLRFTITHADQANPANLARAAAMGIGVTIQDGMAFRGGDSVPTWGEDRVRRAPPLRTMVDMGIPLGAGSDATVVASPNPWVCIRWMVTGQAFPGTEPRDTAELLTRDEALRLYTSGSAWFSFEEETRGNLRPGSHADLAVLSADPLAVAEDRLSSITSLLTLVGGEVVHASPVFAAS